MISIKRVSIHYSSIKCHFDEMPLGRINYSLHRVLMTGCRN